MERSLYLLDGHSLANRAFYALPLLQNSDGQYTNAVFGFARMLFRLLDDEEPDYILVAFDRKAPTFRHEEYEDYKAHRKKMPDELAPQIDLIKKLLKVLQIPIVGKDGYEADDVIGTLARRGEKKGMEVRIVTGDRDALQLVTEKTKVIYTKRGITDIELYDLDKVRERYELEPEQLVDMKGLMGDKSDNIPGVPGIGEKTAIKLLKEFGSLENVLDNIEDVSGKKRKENLRKYGEQARMSKELGRIMVHVPIELDFTKCRLESPDNDEVISFFKKMEFTSLLDRFQEEKEAGVDKINIINIEDEDALDRLVSELQEHKKIALDVLLDDFKSPVRAQEEKMFIYCHDLKVYSLSPGDKELKKLKQILENKQIGKYFLHSKETIIFFRREGINVKGLVFDPLLAAYLLHPADKLPSLDEQLKKELNLVLPEDIDKYKKTAFLLTRLFEIKELLQDKLEDKELWDLYCKLELPLIDVLAKMELNGIKVDKDYLDELSRRWEEELNDITEEIFELAGEEFNINSPKQLGNILFEKLGLPVIKRTKTGYSTSASVLDELEDKHEIIPLIKEYRTLMKLKSTYVDSLPPLINPETGRLHTSFNQMVTATGRLSSTEPNLQNIPIRTEEGREIRKAFIPGNKDWCLLAADYSQVELRVLAHISQDENLIEAFINGEDIHTETASEVFGVKPSEVTSNMRREAKVINFGIAYGMSPYGLARDLNISRKEAEDYINRYFERFSGVKRYMEEVVDMAKEKGYVSTIFNRRRYIPEIRSRNYHRRNFAKRTAINTPIQGSAADIMKLAMLRVDELLSRDEFIDKARILLQVHDELVLEINKDIVSRLAPLVKEEMEKATELDVPLIVDLQLGDNWRDKKDYQLE